MRPTCWRLAHVSSSGAFHGRSSGCTVSLPERDIGLSEVGGANGIPRPASPVFRGGASPMALSEWRVNRPVQQFRSSHFGGMAMKLQSDLGLYRWK